MEEKSIQPPEISKAALEITVDDINVIITKLMDNISPSKKDYLKLIQITNKSKDEIKSIRALSGGTETLVKDLELAKELIILEEPNEIEEEDENKEEVTVRTISEEVYKAWNKLKEIADSAKNRKLKNIINSDTLLEIERLAKIAFPTTKENLKPSYIKTLSMDQISDIYDRLIKNREDVKVEIDYLSGENIKEFKQYTDKIKLTKELAEAAYIKIAKLNVKGGDFTIEDTRNKWINWAYYYVFAKTGLEPESDMEELINIKFNNAIKTSNYRQTIERGIDAELKKRAAAS